MLATYTPPHERARERTTSVVGDALSVERCAAPVGLAGNPTRLPFTLDDDDGDGDEAPTEKYAPPVTWQNLKRALPVGTKSIHVYVCRARNARKGATETIKMGCLYAVCCVFFSS